MVLHLLLRQPLKEEFYPPNILAGGPSGISHYNNVPFAKVKSFVLTLVKWFLFITTRHLQGEVFTRLCVPWDVAIWFSGHPVVAISHPLIYGGSHR